MTITVCDVFTDFYQVEKLKEIASAVNTISENQGGSVGTPIDYRNTSIKMFKTDLNITVAANAVQKVVLDLGADWQDYKFLAFRGLTVTGQTAAAKSVMLTHATRFCSDAFGTVMVDDYVYTPSGHFLTCKDWAAGTEAGYAIVHPTNTISPQWVSNTQAYQSIVSGAQESVFGSNTTNLDTHMVIKGRYVVYIYKNVDTASHTITMANLFLHNMESQFGY